MLCEALMLAHVTYLLLITPHSLSLPHSLSVPLSLYCVSLYLYVPPLSLHCVSLYLYIHLSPCTVWVCITSLPALCESVSLCPPLSLHCVSLYLYVHLSPGTVWVCISMSTSLSTPCCRSQCGPLHSEMSQHWEAHFCVLQSGGLLYTGKLGWVSGHCHLNNPTPFYCTCFHYCTCVCIS